MVGVIGIHVGVVLSIVLQERPIIWPLHNDTIHRTGKGADFYAVYHASLNLTLGRAPYSDEPDGVTPYWYPFRYLPVVAWAFQPLTRLPPAVAYLAWIAVTELLTIWLCVALGKRIADDNLRLTVISLLLLNSPWFLELYMGQFTFVSIALCYLGLLLPAGPLLFSASVLLKPFTLAAVPALTGQRSYWWHVGLAVMLLVATSAPYFINHPQHWELFFNTNFRLEGGLHAGNYGFLRITRLIVNAMGGAAKGTSWEAMTTAFRFGLLGITTALVLLARKRSVLAEASALILAHFVTYQHVWEHHLSAVAVAGAVLLTLPDRSKRFDTVVLSSLLLIALPTLFGVFDTAKDPAVFDPSVDWPIWASLLVVAPKVIPTIALYGAAVAYVCGDGLCAP